MTEHLAALAARPRMRGWLHLWAFVVSVIAGLVLVAVAGSTRGPEAALATSVYALTVMLLFGTSAIYHRVHWSTPGGRALLAVVWFGALGGVLLKTSWITAPRWLSVPLYLGLGWVAVFVLPSLLRHGGVAAFVLIIAGGLIYTLGGIVYGLKRPDPWPRTFGYHEVFHLCTVVAATCHMIAVWLAVY